MDASLTRRVSISEPMQRYGHPVTANPYTPAKTSASSTEKPPSPRRYSALDAIAMPWIATGFSLVASTLAASFYANGGDARNLLRSDDHYIVGFIVSVFVSGCFIAASACGWWRGSRTTAFLASVVSIALTSTVMWLLDYFWDFGEGDQFVAALGCGIAIGGTAGLLAFPIRQRYAVLISAVFPFFLYVVCFFLALRHLQFAN